MVSLKVSIIIIIWCTTWNLLVQFLPCFAHPHWQRIPPIQQWVYQIWWSDSDGFAIRSSSETESLLLSQKFTHPLFAWPFPLHIELIFFEVKYVFSSHDHRSIGGVPSRSRVLPTCTLSLAISAWLLQIWMSLAWLRWTKPFPSWFDFQQMGWNRRNASARMAHTRKTVIPSISMRLAVMPVSWWPAQKTPGVVSRLILTLVAAPLNSRKLSLSTKRWYLQEPGAFEMGFLWLDSSELTFSNNALTDGNPC